LRRSPPSPPTVSDLLNVHHLIATKVQADLTPTPLKVRF
jgi:hypothetical protein